jgi:hypothetical protein
MATSTYYPNSASCAVWGKYMGAYSPPTVWGRPSAADDPGTTFSGPELNTVSTDDANSVLRTGGGSVWTEDRVLLVLSEGAGDITQIDVTTKSSANFFGDAFDTHKLSVGNQTSSAWELKDQQTGGFDLSTQTFTFSLTSSITDYVDGSGNFELLLSVYHAHGGTVCRLRLFYAQVVVTYSTGWAHTINSVASANLGKVNSVLKANISEINQT